MASPSRPSTPSTPSTPASNKPTSSPFPAAPIPPPVPVETHPNRTGLKPSQRPPPDPTRLAPEDAYFAYSPPRLRSINVPRNNKEHAASLRHLHRTTVTPAAVAALRPPPAVPDSAPKQFKDSRKDRDPVRKKKKRKGQWKKLLWVRQSYPDNYTDTETFLDHLQRNPRLQPYDFWPLVSDFTVIVQHVCSVVIFLCCFTVIFQERVSPISVVSYGSICSVLGWVLWDFWIGKEQSKAARLFDNGEGTGSDGVSNASSCNRSSEYNKENNLNGLGLGLDMSNMSDLPGEQSAESNTQSSGTSATSIHSPQSPNTPLSSISYNLPTTSGEFPSTAPCDVSSGDATSPSTPSPPSSFFSPQNHQRLATAKSAVLIFCALRGLSPILKSLTKSTTSDSIWAMSCWLMVINIFFFDYGTGEKDTASGGTAATKFPASLSTNAALMASTVLASRLKSTTHVFSLTLFSIEVFGLFPVFRRQLRVISRRGHALLTVALVISASAAVGITLKGGFAGAMLGILVGGPSTALVMGGCSWWLIGLQKYKNVVIGPWDPAKPVLRRHWD